MNSRGFLQLSIHPVCFLVLEGLEGEYTYGKDGKPDKNCKTIGTDSFRAEETSTHIFLNSSWSFAITIVNQYLRKSRLVSLFPLVSFHARQTVLLDS
jgi:hypothetical protein